MEANSESSGVEKVESSTVPEEEPSNPQLNEPKDSDREDGRNFRRNRDDKFRGSKQRYFRNSNENQGGPRGGWDQQQQQEPQLTRDFGRDKEQARISDYLGARLFEIAGPTHDLEPIDMKEKKFSGRNRLYVGNLPNDLTEDTLKGMFSQFGEIDEIFINRQKCFAFVVFDYNHNARRAKQELDGTNVNDWQLRIRFSPKCTTVKVTNLPFTVTNELLYHAFRIFGDIERAIVFKDDRGRSTGTGEIDFERKKSAALAVQQCTEGCFFLTNSPRPCMVELYEPFQDFDGYGEKQVIWKNNEFLKDRESGPWFAKPNSFEAGFATKWKQIRELYKQKEEALKEELRIEEDKMLAQMGFIKYEYETEMLKKQLEEREHYWQQQKLELEKKERRAEELKMRNEEELRRKEELIKAKLARHEEELNRRQKESSFYQSDERRYEEHDGRFKEGYWQQEVSAAAEDTRSQGSRGGILEEPVQVWKRLDDAGFGTSEELFQRRPNARNFENNSLQFKRNWEENYDGDYNYGKRNRF